MTRSMLWRGLALSGFALLVSSCSLFTDNKPGSFTLSLSDPALSLSQGVQDTVIVTVARRNYDKPVALTLDGVPSGVSAVLTPGTLPSPSQTSLLVLSASGTATVGTATVTVHANGEGITEQNTTFDLTISVTGNFSLTSLGAAPVAAQGGGASSVIVVTRSGGHADNITLSVSGAPTGVIASISPTPASGATASLTITVAPSAVVGTYPLTVTGIAPGLPNQTTTVSLSVIAAPSTATLAMPFCSNSVPTWFAYQNEGFGWQSVSPVAATFTFAATAKVAVAYAYVIQNATRNETQVHFFFADRAELAAQSDRDCQGAKAVNGSVVGASSGQSVRIAMGATIATATQAAPTFNLPTVPERVLDLVATKGAISTSLSDIQIVPDMVLVRRAQNPAPNATLPALDFGGSEAFAPASNTITIANSASGDQFNVVSTFWTATNTYGAISASQPTTTTSTINSVPLARMTSGELHEVLVEANQPSFFSGRVNVAYLGALSDRTETLSPVLPTPSVSTLASTPYTRLRGQVAAQAEYPAATRFVFFQDGGASTDRLVFVVLTRGYLGAPPASTWDVSIPDVGTVFGFNTNWMLSTSSVLYQAETYAGRGAVLFGGVPVVGDVVKVAYRVQASGGLLRADQNVFRSQAQYLRR